MPDDKPAENTRAGDGPALDAVAAPGTIAEWAEKYQGQCVLACGDEIVAWAATASKAWRSARPKLRRRHISKHQVVQMFF